MSGGYAHRSWSDAVVAAFAPRRAASRDTKSCQCIRTQETMEGGAVRVYVCAACAVAGALVRAEGDK